MASVIQGGGVDSGKGYGKIRVYANGCDAHVIVQRGNDAPASAVIKYSNPITIRNHVYQEFSDVSNIVIVDITGGTQGVCTWGTKSCAFINSGDKISDYAGWVASENPEDDTSLLQLRILDDTVICITPQNPVQVPIYYGIDASTLEYKFGPREDFAQLVKASSSELFSGYGVIFADKYNPAVGDVNKINVFAAVPYYAGANKVIMMYNSDPTTPSGYPDARAASIPAECPHSEGKIIRAKAYARWIRVLCEGTLTGEINSSTGGPVFDVTYTPRIKAPSNSNQYYLAKPGVKNVNPNYPTGWNPCILGNDDPKYKLRPTPNSVLPNCVGYAVGRFNEIGGYGKCKYLGSAYAENFITLAKKQGLTISNSPSLGACMVWQKGPTLNHEDGAGHVAIVEGINKDGSVLTSESGWGYTKNIFSTPTRSNKNGRWGKSSEYKFLGFIKNPAVIFTGLADSILTPSIDPSIVNQGLSETQPATTIQGSDSSQQNYFYEGDLIGTIKDTRGKQLLTMPTLVESPFIEVKIGDYTFGSYTREGTIERTLSTARVNYPNYMDSLHITKVNGAVNQYVLTMSYQIQSGDDPNLIDKILSTAGVGGKLTLTYGDWNTPSFIYKNEEATITKVTTTVDFQASRIRYIIYCIGAGLKLKGKVYEFKERKHTKPSTVIYELLYNNTTYGLLEIFYGMKDESTVRAKGFIPTDDMAVDIKAQNDIDIISYLNYLVECMASSSTQDKLIKDASYYLSMRDETTGELDGPYFKVIKVNTSTNALAHADMYEIDVGFPTNTLVLNFQVNNDQSWSILYKYAQADNLEQYIYKIDNNGNMTVDRSPNIMTSNVYKETTEIGKSWWTQVTKFPVSATLTIKGLLRPVMLMEKVKINAVFYGQRHISSGLYLITSQEDDINRSGYRTTLHLQRIAGDEDMLYNITQSIESEGTPVYTSNEDISKIRQSLLAEAAKNLDNKAKLEEIAKKLGMPVSQVAYIANENFSHLATVPDPSVKKNVAMEMFMQ